MRRRIAIGVLAAVAAVVAGLLIGRPGKSDLAVAGERMHAQNMRGTFAIKADTGSRRFSFAGSMLEVADGSRGRLTGIVEQPSAGAVPVDLIVVHDDTWMRFPSRPRLLPRGKRWVHMVDRSSTPQSLTPSQFSRFLADAGDVSKVGDARVSGLSTTHYRATLSAREVVHEIGGATEKRFDSHFGDRDLKIPVEAWIARDGLPRRLKVAMSLGDASIDIVIQIARYGVPVPTHAPPRQQVIEERDWDAYTQADGQSS